MKQFIKALIPKPALAYIQDKRSFLEWKRRQYASPSPPSVKRKVLVRCGLPDGTWVETGTYMGDTTAFLSEYSKHVYTIEPSPELFKRAQARFSSNQKITCINGLSEQIFHDLLPKLSGKVNFWLDGHFSAGVTFKGPVDTPIVEELKAVEKNLARYQRAAVFIDDVRCFDPVNPEYREYPKRAFLVEWAERNGLDWHIEHDIFIALKK